MVLITWLKFAILAFPGKLHVHCYFQVYKQTLACLHACMLCCLYSCRYEYQLAIISNWAGYSVFSPSSMLDETTIDQMADYKCVLLNNCPFIAGLLLMMSIRRQKEQNFQSNGRLQKSLCTVNLAANLISGLMVSYSTPLY